MLVLCCFSEFRGQTSAEPREASAGFCVFPGAVFSCILHQVTLSCWFGLVVWVCLITYHIYPYFDQIEKTQKL